ncbi:MAG TPA: hypothetical protein DDW33_11110 [Ktedonobacter sp.]|jgi:hypothetical protein|nr:hypothetical protein [Ktedonobacter sp.]HAG97429.1 hypothetical protein [Ktedonobacter sp.]HBE26223.1 hypothetical protein [Ktedonobacter sp.]HBE27493.1 hypothetical protein [Ktedonobacter sp.]HCF88226.1 hypothetical protein [Ktedonobacter sp.]
MKCTTCGFPLSPTNTNMPCPRCHNSTTSNPKFVVQQQIPFSFPEQAPFPQLGQLFQSAPTPAPINMQAELHQNNAPYGATNRTPEATYSALSAPTPALRPQTRHASNLGFIVAGLCVFAGGLILILVYFMAIGLPPSSSANSYTTAPVVTKNTPSTLLTAAPSPKIVPSATTGAFPGQQYIDNSQMASTVNMNTAQPLHATTTFKVNQKMYVTFNIHPDNKNGAVCLYWYLNNKNVTQFPFSVTANAKAGYSYAIYGGAGTAFVEIYWASTTTCSDKLLAQHVNFTVTP